MAALGLVIFLAVPNKFINADNQSCGFKEERNETNYSFKLNCVSVSMVGKEDAPKKPTGMSEAELQAIAAEKAKAEATVSEVFNKIGTTNVSTYIGRIINGLMGIMGSLALVMFVYGGVLWMTSAGESERAEKARSIVVWSVLGLAVIFASYALVNFVFEAFK